MKSFILAAIALSSSLAFAGEVTLLEASIRPTQFRPYVDVKFQMDKSTGDGYVRVSVTEERMNYGGYYDHQGRYIPNNFPTLFRVYETVVKVDNLRLEDKKVVYYGEEGTVECGTMGLSRVLKVPTLFLNGNCKLEGYLQGFRQGERVIVKLITK